MSCVAVYDLGRICKEESILKEKVKHVNVSRVESDLMILYLGLVIEKEMKY